MPKANLNLEIRRVEEDNFKKLIELLNRLAKVEEIKPPDAEAVERLKLDALGGNLRYEAHLAYLDNEPVGCAVFLWTYSSYLAKPTLFLEDLFVLKEYRRQGIGRRLLQFCLKEARKRGCGRMEWICFAKNKDAIGFYEKLNINPSNQVFYRLSEEEIEDICM